MNIVEAYIKFHKGLIILISGLSGSNKTQIAKFIEEDFKIKRLNMEHFTTEYNNHVITLSNGTKIIDWDHIDAYDWDVINKGINDNKQNGVIISGSYFPTNKLNFNPDFHINIKVSKQILVEQRLKYIKSNPNKFKHLESIMDNLDEQMMLLLVNQITYPHYLDYTAQSKIDKYINFKDLTIDKMYDQVSDFLFFKIQEFLKNIKEQEQNLEVDSTGNLKIEKIEDLDDSSSLSENNEDSSPIYLGEILDEDKWWTQEQTY